MTPARFNRFSAGQLLRRLLPFRNLVSQAGSLLTRIAAEDQRLRSWTSHDLRQFALSLQYRAQSGEPLEQLLPSAYAAASLAVERTLALRPYPVQLLAATVLRHRAVIELPTGEGKTLTALFPAFLYALRGEGVHVATANDYLARRDAQLLKPVWEALGMSVGVVEAATPRGQRQQAYRCHVTYGTAREFGFDFLRDRLAAAQRRSAAGSRWARMAGADDPIQEPLQRRLFLALIDEADSILIDEARTPLVISATSGSSPRLGEAAVRWAAVAVRELCGTEHWDVDPQHRFYVLNAAGRRRVRETPRPDELADVPVFELYAYVETALRAARDFHRDQHYMLRGGSLVLVDELTGRPAEGRQWRDGLHQAVQAKEGLPISPPAEDAARISIQELFLSYEHLLGMTGTGWSARREFQTTYRLPVVRIEPRLPVRRVLLPAIVCGTSEARWAAVVEEVKQLHALGRPVLIGTRSIDKSEHLSARLAAAGIPHRVLHARHLALEAEVVALAGEAGQVTVATNMAGRGTDIRLGAGVAGLGGLHVIGTELNDSARIDQQLQGRCGRQGDPGSFRQFLSLEDEILSQAYGRERAERWRRAGQRAAPRRPSYGLPTLPRGGCSSYLRLFFRAQARLERRHYQQRRALYLQECERTRQQRELGADPYLSG